MFQTSYFKTNDQNVKAKATIFVLKLLRKRLAAVSDVPVSKFLLTALHVKQHAFRTLRVTAHWVRL